MQRTIFTGILLSATCLAQDPTPPPGGFGISLRADNRITYSDGYRTLMDLRVPNTTAPRTGWPTAMILHGGGGSRNRSWVVTICELLCRNGYATISYDTGGNGATKNLNPPVRRTDDLRMRDVAEMFLFAKRILGARMDENRFAMMGKSGGAKHSLWGASYSGKPLPTTSALVTHMPRLRAIFTDIQVLDFVSDHLPNGDMIRAHWFVSHVEHLGPNDPSVQLFLNRNYAALEAMLQADVGSAFFPLLRQSDVPIFVSYAYDDSRHFVNVNADAFPKLKSGVPNRFLLGTGGHASADNANIGALRRDYIHRWFDRFLKNENNGVEKEPFAEIAMIANDASRYTDRNSFWKHRHRRTWPIAPNTRFYLRGGKRLMASAPAGIEAGGTLRHRVAPGYDELDFAADKGIVARVTQKMPGAAVTFDTPPMQQPKELLGRSIVELDVINAGAANAQMSAALLDVPPTGSPRFITSGTAALRQKAPGRHRMRIVLGDVGYILRAGHKLRLSLENINVKRQPGNPHIYVLPEFHNYDLTVQIDPAFAPRLMVPLNDAGSSLMPRFGRVRGSAAFSHQMGIAGESGRAGDPYLILLGASGAWPGFNAPPHVPLNIDVFTHIGLSVTNTPFLANFLGTLDAQGNGRPRLSLPQPVAAATIGMQFHLVGTSIRGGQHSVTNPVELNIEL